MIGNPILKEGGVTDGLQQMGFGVAILKITLAELGLELVDGRKRRSQLAIKHQDQPLFMASADRVKELADEKRKFGEIAAILGIDRNTVTSSGSTGTKAAAFRFRMGGPVENR